MGLITHNQIPAGHRGPHAVVGEDRFHHGSSPQKGREIVNHPAPHPACAGGYRRPAHLLPGDRAQMVALQIQGGNHGDPPEILLPTQLARQKPRIIQNPPVRPAAAAVPVQIFPDCLEKYVPAPLQVVGISPGKQAVRRRHGSDHNATSLFHLYFIYTTEKKPLPEESGARRVGCACRADCAKKDAPQTINPQIYFAVRPRRSVMF